MVILTKLLFGLKLVKIVPCYFNLMHEERPNLPAVPPWFMQRVTTAVRRSFR